MQVVNERSGVTAQSKLQRLILDPLQFVYRRLGICRVGNWRSVAKEGLDICLVGDKETLLIFAKGSV